MVNVVPIARRILLTVHLQPTFFALVNPDASGFSCGFLADTCADINPDALGLVCD